MFSVILELIMYALDKIVSTLGTLFMVIAGQIITGVFNAFFGLLELNGHSAASLTWAPKIFDSALIIAYTLTFVICIYGFLIENLDFHTYDGWDRVIRLLLRIVIVSILIAASGEILRAGRSIILGVNELAASQENVYLGHTYSLGEAIGSFWPGLKYASSASALSGTSVSVATAPNGVRINFEDDTDWHGLSGLLSVLPLASVTSAIFSALMNAFGTSASESDWTSWTYPVTPTYTTMNAGVDNAANSFSSGVVDVFTAGIFDVRSFIIALWIVFTHIVGIVVVVALTVLILKKIFKMALNLIVPFLEFYVLASLLPIGLSFYASHSTQHVGQSYVRNFIKTGLQIAFKIFVLIAISAIGTALLSKLNLSTLIGSGGVHTLFNQLTCGHADDVSNLFSALITLTVAEMALDRTEHLSAKVFGG